ncbi:hypothetical protein SeLEV6574_g02554 [Synchytrium endobioticum]|uniref:Methionine synthase reductase n=1 Tax=Synchytrium endobioticum TaxID=286115 RepID=A0A507D8G9_9FUNG|nr:hypothetical protein SeLEV6574_g02554 [Synchytrium endobioticum]
MAAEAGFAISASRAPSIIIFWASPSGTAECIAHWIYESSRKRGFTAHCHVLDGWFKADLTSDCVVIFVFSITANGDPPDNATKFLCHLQNTSGAELGVFKNMRYTVLALGEPNYDNSFHAAKWLDCRMSELGGVPFHQPGFAPDAVGLESILDPWIEKLWSCLEQKEGPAEACNTQNVEHNDESSTIGRKLKRNGDSATVQPEASTPLPSARHASNIAEPPTTKSESSVPSINSPSLLLIDTTKLAGTTQLTNVPKLLPFILTAEPTGFRRPSIESSHEFFAETVSTTASLYSVLRPFLAPISTVRTLTGCKALKKVLEITLDIRSLNWKYQAGDSFGLVCPNADELVHNLLDRLKLKKDDTFHMSSSMPSLPFRSKIPLTYYEVLKYHIDLRTFPRKSLFRMFAESTTDDAERNVLFFLASAQGNNAYQQLRQQQPTLLDLLHTFKACEPPFAHLLEHMPRLQPRIHHAAANITIGTRPVQRAFHPPSDPTTNMICISAGTGITPFVGFLQHWEGLKASGMVWLFHGFRTDGEDTLYQAELQGFVDRGVLSVWTKCMSNEVPRRYVQDGIEEHAESVWEWVDQKKASVYLCGSAAMGKSVHACFLDMTASQTKGGLVESQEYWSRMASGERYVREIWT